MLVFKLHGGLGNQLFQYAFARQLSFFVEVKFDLSNFTDNIDQRSLLITNFNTQLPITHYKNSLVLKNEESRLIDRFFRFIKRELPYHRKYYFSDKHSLQFQDKYFKKEHGYFDGYWNDYRYFNRIANELKVEITLKQENQSSAFKEIKSKIETNNSVGVHIRRGDYTSLKNINTFGVLPISYYKTSIDLLNSRFTNCKFFIFTDDLEWTIEHLPKNINAIVVKTISELTDCEEFELLKNCNHQIIANSTFSWWAAYLNKNPDKIIIYPNQWYKEEALQNTIYKKKLFPNNWIRIAVR